MSNLQSYMLAKQSVSRIMSLEFHMSQKQSEVVRMRIK